VAFSFSVPKENVTLDEYLLCCVGARALYMIIKSVLDSFKEYPWERISGSKPGFYVDMGFIS